MNIFLASVLILVSTLSSCGKLKSGKSNDKNKDSLYYENHFDLSGARVFVSVKVPGKFSARSSVRKLNNEGEIEPITKHEDIVVKNVLRTKTGRALIEVDMESESVSDYYLELKDGRELKMPEGFDQFYFTEQGDLVFRSRPDQISVIRDNSTEVEELYSAKRKNLEIISSVGQFITFKSCPKNDRSYRCHTYVFDVISEDYNEVESYDSVAIATPKDGYVLGDTGYPSPHPVLTGLDNEPTKVDFFDKFRYGSGFHFATNRLASGFVCIVDSSAKNEFCGSGQSIIAHLNDELKLVSHICKSGIEHRSFIATSLGYAIVDERKHLVFLDSKGTELYRYTGGKVENLYYSKASYHKEFEELLLFSINADGKDSRIGVVDLDKLAKAESDSARSAAMREWKVEKLEKLIVTDWHEYSPYQ